MISFHFESLGNTLEKDVNYATQKRRKKRVNSYEEILVGFK